MAYYFVNQKTTFSKAYKEGFIWAPYTGKTGNTHKNWDLVDSVKPGDIIFSNKDSKIVAISVATSGAYSYEKPEGYKREWSDLGRRVNVKYHKIENPMNLRQHRKKLKEKYNEAKVFTDEGKPQQGYLYQVDDKLATYLLDCSQLSEKEIAQEIVPAKEFYEDVMDDQFQNDQINNLNVPTYSDEEIASQEKKKYQYEEETNITKNTRVKTDIKLKATRLERAQWKCEIDHNHKTFLNSKETHNYMECHHIIPVNLQKYFKDLNLDQLFNLIAVCPICHAQVHYGSKEARNKMFHKMYEVRKTEFDKKKISYNDLKLILERGYKI